MFRTVCVVALMVIVCAASMAAPLTQGVRGTVLSTTAGGAGRPPESRPIGSSPSPEVPAGKGIPGVEVLIYQCFRQPGRGGYTDRQGALVKRVVTDASGHFEVALAPGRYILRSGRDKDPATLPGTAAVDVKAGQVTTLWLAEVRNIP